MAEARAQINAKVVPATKALLLTYCQEKHTTQSDVVEAALRTFLQPKEGDDLTMVMLQLLHGIAEKQATLEQGVGALVPLLTSIVERLEDAKVEPAVPIARYDQMYEALRPAPPPDAVEVPPAVPPAPVPAVGWWGRVFAPRTAP
jgi:hypothetical protein